MSKKVMSWWNILLYGCLWYFNSIANGQDEDNWSKQLHEQLHELKSMLMVLDSRMLKMESKFVEINFLEGAFKVNSIDENLKRIETSAMLMDARMNRLEVQVDTIKELLKNLSGSSSCKGVQIQRTTARPQNSGRGGAENPLCKDLTEKVEDYSYKLTKSQQELKESSQRHQQALSNLLDTVRNGFTKTFQKVDILPNTERQLTRMSSSISKISTQYPETLEKLTSISDRLSSVQSNLARTTAQTSSSASVSEDRISTTLTRAIEFGNQVKKDLSGLLEIEPEITKATIMAKDLLIGLDNRRPTSLEILKNLTVMLEDMGTTVNPLLFSMTYNSDGIHELLETTLASMHKNKTTVCNFQEVFKLELKRLKDSIEKQNQEQCHQVPAEHGQDSGSNSGNIQEAPPVMKHKDVFDNLGYVTAAVSLVQTDLKELFKNCPDGSVQKTKSLGMIIG